jgi:hypothetical protein
MSFGPSRFTPLINLYEVKIHLVSTYVENNRLCLYICTNLTPQVKFHPLGGDLKKLSSEGHS